MSVKLTIGSQVISFPENGASPSWAPGVIAFAQAVTQQLQGITSAFDVPPSVQVLATDTNSGLNIQNAIFPSNQVRSFVFTYAIYKTNGVTSIAEDGSVKGVYDTLNSMWSLAHSFSGPRETDGTAYNTFSMSGDQLTLSTAPIGGSYDGVNSKISYEGKTILVSDL